MIVGVNDPVYRRKWERLTSGRYNGAYYYAQEIEHNIIPNVDTDRNWILLNVKKCADHSIVFIHNNLHPENYEWLKKYKDLVLVCGIEETVEKVEHLGKAIYLPLSIDVEYVKQFAIPKKEKTKECAVVGRPKKLKGVNIEGADFIMGLPREELLPMVAQYRTVYAVGRTAIEAKALKCNLKAYDERYPKVSRWKVLDNKEAAKLLQEKLDEIDGRKDND